jgi:DNA-directed RNA polymerase subunit N (RpoN/RPB10)
MTYGGKQEAENQDEWWKSRMGLGVGRGCDHFRIWTREWTGARSVIPSSRRKISRGKKKTFLLVCLQTMVSFSRLLTFLFFTFFPRSFQSVVSHAEKLLVTSGTHTLSCSAIMSPKGARVLLCVRFVTDPCYSEALDELQLKRYCCRRMVLTHVDLIEKLLHYNREQCPMFDRTCPQLNISSLTISDGAGKRKGELLDMPFALCSLPAAPIGIYSPVVQCSKPCRLIFPMLLRRVTSL